MDKVVYLSLFNPSRNGNGVDFKIYNQIECMKRAGFAVFPIKYNRISNKINNLLCHYYIFNVKKNNKIINTCKSAKIIYIRYFLSDSNLLKLLSKIRYINNNVNIILEIATYPYDFEFKKRSVALYIDKKCRNKLYKYVDRIVTYSSDKTIYNVPSINISNGVSLEKITPRIPYESCNNTINIIFVAQISFWHGYDRAIKGLHDYYKKGGKINIRLHIVGDGVDKVINEYKDMVKKYALQDHVIFYGRKSGNELDNIYNKCQLAMDSLGRHRTKVYYNSTLKGKEYLAKGLPVISGVTTELDDYKDFKYYMRVPADDSPLDFTKIIEFYNMIYKNKYQLKVIQEIRKFCEKHFEFSKTFKPVIDYLNNENEV